ncbi:MAG: DUF885 family protein [Chloroflexi bacterium]|nr:DUF885 family protein [Chloroflexota bacterium]
MVANADVQALGEAFWKWRAATQPSSGDDIPRIERPAKWAPDWSAEAVEGRRGELSRFEREHAALGTAVASGPVADQVDWRLLGSALARMRWELDVLRGWQRNPHFYVHQTVTALFESLLPPPPFTAERTSDLLARVESIPRTLDAGRENLSTDAVAPFARLAFSALEGVGPRLSRVAAELVPVLDASGADRVEAAMATAARALEQFAEWLRSRAGGMSSETALGRQAYVNFLRKVAIIDLTPEQIMAGARQELERSIAFEAMEVLRNRGEPPWKLPSSAREQVEREVTSEMQVRSFCEEHELLTFPSWLRHYRYAPEPTYLAPLRGSGVFDDLTSAARLDEDGVHYIPEPTPDLPYFYLAMARDARTLIAHEGVHYYQLARSWHQPNGLRRFYYDSGSNEGIGFYAEEMLLQAGLFDDSPRSREIIYNFMRLRAIRVDIDIRLALGQLTIESAAAELASRVPMDADTAREEASFFASEPGQAITYQTGKLQVVGYLADARRAQGQAFRLREFHDRLWDNGNVPIALQRWESLGLNDQVPAFSV